MSISVLWASDSRRVLCCYSIVLWWWGCDRQTLVVMLLWQVLASVFYFSGDCNEQQNCWKKYFV